MFRKSYKNAVDSIGINNELKNILLEKAENASIPKANSKLFTKNRIYTFSGMAAAAAIMVISLNALNSDKILKQSDDMIKPQNTVTETEIKPEKEVISKANNIIEEKTKNQEIVKSETSLSDGINDSILPPVQEESNTETVNSVGESENNVIAYDKSESLQSVAEISENEIAAVTEASEESEESGVNFKARASGGGSSRMMPMADIKTEEWTKEQYYSHIGINIEGIAVIPEDMQNQTENTVYITKDKDGNITNDYFNFIFTGENERYINISTVKTQESDCDWNKTVSDTNYMSAKSVKSGVQINVEAYMLTEDEQNALLDSLK